VKLGARHKTPSLYTACYTMGPGSAVMDPASASLTQHLARYTLTSFHFTFIAARVVVFLTVSRRIRTYTFTLAEAKYIT
jgi:hypothetical protein